MFKLDEKVASEVMHLDFDKRCQFWGCFLQTLIFYWIQVGTGQALVTQVLGSVGKLQCPQCPEIPHSFIPTWDYCPQKLGPGERHMNVTLLQFLKPQSEIQVSFLICEFFLTKAAKWCIDPTKKENHVYTYKQKSASQSYIVITSQNLVFILIFCPI